MATTTNHSISRDWSLLAAPADTVFISNLSDLGILEGMPMAAEATPTISGHRARPGQQLSSSVIGTGYWYVRVSPDSPVPGVLVAVTK